MPLCRWFIEIHNAQIIHEQSLFVGARPRIHQFRHLVFGSKLVEGQPVVCEHLPLGWRGENTFARRQLGQSSPVSHRFVPINSHLETIHWRVATGKVESASTHQVPLRRGRREPSFLVFLANRRFKFQKRSQLLIRSRNEMLAGAFRATTTDPAS
jgi:hypothetical protein